MSTLISGYKLMASYVYIDIILLSASCLNSEIVYNSMYFNFSNSRQNEQIAVRVNNDIEVDCHTANLLFF